MRPLEEGGLAQVRRRMLERALGLFLHGCPLLQLLSLESLVLLGGKHLGPPDGRRLLREGGVSVVGGTSKGQGSWSLLRHGLWG